MLDDLKYLAKKSVEYIGMIDGEEVTKMILIVPMLKILGYDIFNPFEVRSEYVCDVGIKKGEKVDYALFKENKLIMLVEAKDYKETLNKNNINQLYRYFGASTAKLAVLTNGIVYMFFTDSVKENIMDLEPFYIFRLDNFSEDDVYILKMFMKEELNYTTIKEFIKSQEDVIIEKADVIVHSAVTTTEVNSLEKLSGLVELNQLNKENIKGLKLLGMFLEDEMYAIKTWTEALLTLLQYCVMLDKSEEFLCSLDNVNDLNSGWIKNNSFGMRQPKRVGATDIFIDTHGSAITQLGRLKMICRKIGLPEEKVLLEIK